MTCKDFDGQVVRLEDELDALKERFVRVRITAMDGVDLSRFRFDFDMSWAGVFLHPDGTVLGRYGSRDAGPDAAHVRVSVRGLANAMERALALFDDYPENRDALAGKQPSPLAWRTIDDVPTRRRMAFGSCYHCHHVGEALMRATMEAGEALDEASVWPYPPASRVGLSLDSNDDLTVTRVDPGSPAAAASIEVGDRLVSAGGQPLVSHADLQWVLHHLPAETSLDVVVKRSGEPFGAVVALESGWRRGGARWRESRWTLRPGVAFRRLAAEERARRDVASEDTALLVTRVYGNAVRRGGLLRGDVVVAVEGLAGDVTEGELLAWLRSRHRLGDEVPVEVVRGGERVALHLRVE